MITIFRDLGTVARGQDHGDFWKIAPNSSCEFNAAHSRHYNVRKHDMEAVAIFGEFIQGILSIGGKNTVVTKLMQSGRCEISDAGIVFDD